MSSGRFARILAAAAGWVLIPLAGPAATPGATGEVAPPAQVPGLVAWYEVASLHRHMRNGETVERWTDSSRQGHDLAAVSETERPVFETLALNKRPVVAVSRNTRFDLARPFELDDHTIFLVYSSEFDRRAFFRSDSDRSLGLVLGERGQSHAYQKGKRGRFSYNRPRPLDLGYGITVLGRDSGVLRAFVNGVDLSSGVEFPDRIRVGRFFELQFTTFVSGDGGGLRIAEMIFYDRYLTESERATIEEYLSAEYGIEVEETVETRRVVKQEEEEEAPIDEAAVVARLESRSTVNLNDTLVPIGWDAGETVDPPFRFDVEAAKTELHCTKNATRVRATVVLPLQSGITDAKVRLLLLVNGEDYHPEEAVSGPFTGDGADRRAELRLTTELILEADDFLEIVASQGGAPGEVRIAPDGGLFVLERIE